MACFLNEYVPSAEESDEEVVEQIKNKRGKNKSYVIAQEFENDVAARKWVKDQRIWSYHYTNNCKSEENASKYNSNITVIN